MNKAQDANCKSETVRLTPTTADALYDGGDGTERQVNGKKGQTNSGWQCPNDIDPLIVN